MYRGFIMEVGRVVAADGPDAVRAGAEGVRAASRRAARCRSRACASSVVEVGDDEFRADVSTETARRSTLGELAAGGRSTSSCRSGRATPSRVTSCRATSTRSAR